MQSTPPPRLPSRIRLPFLTSLATAGTVHENVTLESNYAQLSQQAILQDVARQCGVDSIELVSSRDLGVRVVATSRATNAQAVSAVSCLLRFDNQGQTKPGLLMVPVHLTNQICAEAKRIELEDGSVQIVEGTHIEPAKAFPMLVLAAPHLPAVDTERRVGQAVRRLQDVLMAAAGTKPMSDQYQPQDHQQQHQQQPLVSPWGDLPAEQQHSTNVLGSQQQALPAWNVSHTTTKPSSLGASLPRFWQSHPSSQPFSLPPSSTATVLLQESARVLHQHFGLVPAEPESRGRDLFQEWSLLLHGTPDLSAEVRESVALAILKHEDLLFHAAAAIMGSGNGSDSTVARGAAAAEAAAAAAREYLQGVRCDWSFVGGRLEMTAAARCFNVSLVVYDAEEQEVLHFDPLLQPLSSPFPPGGGCGGGGASLSSSPAQTLQALNPEVWMLHCRGLYWLLVGDEDDEDEGMVAVVEGEEEEMKTEGGTMGTGGEREMDDLSISSQSAASGSMLEG